MKGSSVAELTDQFSAGSSFGPITVAQPRLKRPGICGLLTPKLIIDCVAVWCWLITTGDSVLARRLKQEMSRQSSRNSSISGPSKSSLPPSRVSSRPTSKPPSRSSSRAPSPEQQQRDSCQNSLTKNDRPLPRFSVIGKHTHWAHRTVRRLPVLLMWMWMDILIKMTVNSHW